MAESKRAEAARVHAPDRGHALTSRARRPFEPDSSPTLSSVTPSLWVRVRIPVLVFLALFLVYGTTISTRFVNTDVAANATSAWQIARTGQPWMDGLDLTEPGVVPHYAQGADGHMVATRTPGQIAAASQRPADPVGYAAKVDGAMDRARALLGG